MRLSPIFNQTVKKIAYSILSNRGITCNRMYQKIYTKRMLRLMAEYSVKPARVRLENTNICTAGCKFCPHGKMKRKQGFMSMKLFKKLVRQVVDWDVDEIVIQGFGEPLDDPQFFERVDYCFMQGVRKIQTNINAKSIYPYVANNLLDCALTEIFISCNDEGRENVEYLLSQRRGKYPKIYLSFIKGETAEYSTVHKADGVSVSYPHNWGGKVKGTAGTSLRDPCRLCWCTMYITWDGHAHMCCMDTDAEYKYGDAKSKRLEQIWRRHPWRVTHKARGWDNIPLCKDCLYNYHNKSPWWVK